MQKRLKNLLILSGIFLLSYTNGVSQNLKIKGEFPNPSLTWPFLWDLKILEKGELLCSSGVGQIFSKKNDVWTIIDVPGIDKESIRGVVKDKNGVIWAATDGQGISRYKDGQWVNFKKGSNSLPTDDWICSVLDKTGNVWFGSWSDGLVKYDGNTWKLYTESSSPTTGLASNSVNGIFVDKKNTIWVYSYGDITTIKGTTIKKYSLDNLIDFGIRINDICQDKSGKYYIATSKGIVSSNGTTFNLESASFVNIEVGSIAVDSSGVLWYCETFKGLHRWDKGVKNYFAGTLDNLIPSQTFSIKIDSVNRKLLIGNKGAQVIFIDDSEFTSSTKEQNLQANFNLKVSPNPTSGLVYFEMDDHDNFGIDVVNIYGQKVNCNFVNKTLDLSNLCSGIYIVQIKDLNRNVSKLVKLQKI